MGVWRAWYPFDTHKFYSEVIPAMRQGNLPQYAPWSKTQLDTPSSPLISKERISFLAREMDDSFRFHSRHQQAPDSPFHFDSDFYQAIPDWYDFISFLEWIIFSECARYEPEFATSKGGFESIFDAIPADSSLNLVLEKMEYSTHLILDGGIDGWISHEEIALFQTHFADLRFAEVTESRFGTGKREEFREFLHYCDERGLGMIAGADLREYKELAGT